jgi:hypothetical protein
VGSRIIPKRIALIARSLEKRAKLVNEINGPDNRKDSFN